MRKILCTFIAGSAIAVSLAACGGKPTIEHGADGSVKVNQTWPLTAKQANEYTIEINALSLKKAPAKPVENASDVNIKSCRAESFPSVTYTVTNPTDTPYKYTVWIMFTDAKTGMKLYTSSGVDEASTLTVEPHSTSPDRQMYGYFKLGTDYNCAVVGVLREAPAGNSGE